MQLQTAIENRKSVRKYSEKKPDWRNIVNAIDAARHAPMSGNIFSLKFILVDNAKKIQELSEASQQPFIAKAHFVVAVCTNPEKTELNFKEKSKNYLRQQAGAAIQNFLLALEEKNLHTCWVGHFHEATVKKILSIPEEIQVEAIFPIGLPTKKTKENEKKKSKTKLQSILRFNDYKTKKMKN